MRFPFKEIKKDGVLEREFNPDTPSEELIWHTDLEDRIITIKKSGGWKFQFDNGFGASVIRGPDSYGGSEGLFELGVIGVDGHLNYDTPITNDVIGHLTVDAVNELLDRISQL